MYSSTNLRGYSFLSKSKNIFVQQLEDNFIPSSIFVFDSRFDGVQNLTFDCEEESDIYLMNDNNEKIYLGKTSYKIFLNTSIPYSYPFFNSLKPKMYLVADTDKPIKITYDALIIKKEVLEEFKNQTITSSSLYCVSKNDLYKYKDLEKIHQPIEIEIKY